MIERLGLSMLFLALSVAPVRAADVTGPWRVTISRSDGAIVGVASLKQSGDVVTGWVGPSEDDPIPISGVLKGNKLTIKTTPQPGRTVAFDKCDLTVSGDKMAGAIDTDKGTIEFVKRNWIRGTPVGFVEATRRPTISTFCAVAAGASVL